MKNNVFTTKLLDIIAPKNLEQINFVFLVIDYVDSDLKKVFCSTKSI